MFRVIIDFLPIPSPEILNLFAYSETYLEALEKPALLIFTITGHNDNHLNSRSIYIFFSTLNRLIYGQMYTIILIMDNSIDYSQLIKCWRVHTKQDLYIIGCQ